MKRIIAILLILTFNSFDSQIRKEISILTDSMNSIFEKLPYDHFSEEDIKQIDLLQKLRQKFRLEVNDNELVYIYKNEFTPKVKDEALTEIYKRKNIDKIKLFKETVHLKDTLKLSEYDTYLIQGIFFDAITENDYKITNYLTDYIFSAEPLNIPLIEDITHRIPKNKIYYEKAKKVAVENNAKYLLSYVAEFKNENDIELIKSYGSDSYFAIQKFPSEEFLPFLELMAEKDSKKYEYLATVASFCKNKKSAQLIDKVFKVLNRDNSNINLFEHFLSEVNKCTVHKKSGENSPLDY
ncbi:hypothetical protein [Chryseobacterium gambrini]|uniref:HEAT repeat-containing protein n=1 Tax=Chryseobacterium gambrini TaxID=373672 RepID=A0ABM8K371_9FLAO|nr:hypothetical protein CRDW_07360 [Chryseobacterium gambrini]